MANRVLYIDDITGKPKLGLPPSSFGAVAFVDTATINLTVDGFDNLTADIIISSIINDAIVDGVTARAPSQNAVFDALALKYDASNPASYINAAGARTAVVDDAIIDAVTTRAPSQNAVFDALALKYNASNPANYVDAAGARTAAVADVITDGVTTIAPSQNAVFDALALKRNITLPSFVDEDFDIAVSATTISLATDIVVGNLIDVYINGVLTREGGARAWTRNNTTNQIIFNTALSVNSWVRVRIFT